MEKSPIVTFESYFDLWKRILPPLLGWDDPKVVRWAAQFGDEMADENSPIYHDGPFEYIALQLMKPTFMEELGAARFSQLVSQLKGTLIRSTKHAISAKDVDWQILKNDLNSMLGEFGYSLEDAAQEESAWS